MTILFLTFVAILTNSSDLADSLFDNRNYKNALIEYERLDFFSPDEEWKYKKGLCYANLGRLKESARLFESIGKNRELIKTYILMEEYPLAEYECKKINDKELLGWVKLLVHPPSEKNVIKAQILSSIIPGMGEIYAAKPIQGIFTLGLNLLFGGLSIKSFADHRYLDGTLITLFLWSRFYHGGIENAGKEVYRYNEERRNIYLKEIKEKYGF